MSDYTTKLSDKLFTKKPNKKSLRAAFGNKLKDLVDEKNKIITTFIDSILNSDEDSIVTANDVFNTMSVCFAADEAIQRERPLTISYT